MPVRSFGCVLAVVLLCVAAETLRAEELLEAEPVRKANVSLRLPREWKPQARESAHIVLAATAPVVDSDTTGEYAPGISITAAPGTAVDGDAQQARLAQEIADYQITEKPTTVKINGSAAITFGGTFTRGSLKLRSRQYLLARDSHIYTLTVTALASAWDQHIAAAEASVMSFAIDKK